MKVSINGLDLIKYFEGLRLTAYKAVSTEKYYTIGYGHYGSDVKKDMVISREKADAYLLADIEKSEKAVNNMIRRRNFDLTQNQFDALVSFTFNCGASNLEKLTVHPRTVEEIGEKISLYNKSGGKKLLGLVRRRRAEQQLYKKGYWTK